MSISAAVRGLSEKRLPTVLSVVVISSPAKTRVRSCRRRFAHKRSDGALARCPHLLRLLLDGAKGLYPDVLALVEDRLRPGAFVVADDADASPDYLARVRSTRQGYLSIPFDDDVEVSMRLT
jgi:hypothetical protein